ncbi:hypothetical protein YYC_00410 [Plasmodium yoelii 17X]|uniref:Elongation factor 1-gamma n=3 Tax=Plasmodium yoelii TaxID=5861 RepID=A0AAE9WUD7_PLAYO|nr:elongation factor 1-gamma, putative [Plasmodium yoelii]ETB62718.1 hypothetical protein YYC_00410 [Plasmodium yoelii 17X]WBY60307.1 elongation factor 1-gamma [Plasmodium yoelii yoelii]CDU20187.1 elongation factor 1-gamma, putative [Plasmodium yoelii]VTZ80945.1 elongation factor 1-gamma, putative [Plasmodium yoelii]|eukprot:XP_022813718.1 elongation factor 1-gamma, putative [Plasmodium yoelii]
MDLKLLGPKNDIRCLKVQTVASFCNIKLNMPAFEIGIDDNKDEFVKESPMKRLPVLITPQGSLFESNAIGKYLCSIRKEHNLLGCGCFEEGQVNMWIDFCTFELEIPVCCYISNKSNDKSLKHIQDTFSCLNKHLLLNQYMVGNKITIVDIFMSVIINFCIKSGKMTEDFLKKYGNLYRLYTTIINQKQFKYVMGSGPVGNNKKTPVQPKQTNNNKEKKKPKEDADDDIDLFSDDGLNEKKTKKTNPLDLLPPSKFSLDNWKYKFSNEKDLLKNAMPTFWETYDNNGFSLYYMKYDKLEDECQISFVACNMASGFLQRLENNFSKYSFAVISVLGENKNYDIEGVWLFRGTEIPFEMKDHPSFEYHIFKKLDINNSDDKKLVEDYWCSKEVISNRPVCDRKVWK